MASVTHSFVSAVADGVDDSLVRPSDWNAEHVLSGIDVAFIGCSLLRATDQTGVVTSTDTPVSFPGAEVFDTDGFHSTSSNDSRITIPAGLGGKYLFTASVTWDTNTTGNRHQWFRKNGTTYVGGFTRAEAAGSDRLAFNLSTIVDLTPGDYIEVNVWQDSGGNRTLTGSLIGITFQCVKLDSGKVGTGIGARVRNSGTQSIADQTWTALTFDTEDFDTDGFHSTSSNTSRLTIPAGLGGTYIMGGNYDIAFNATGQRAIRVFKNGTTRIGGEQFLDAQSASTTRLLATTVAQLVAGDYVTLEAWQNSTVSLNSNNVADFAPLFWIARLDSGGAGGGGSITVSETDASPSVSDVTEIQFPSDTVTDLGGGIVSIRDVPSAFIGASVALSAGAAHAVSTATYTAVNLDTEHFDTDGFHSTVTNTSRFTIPAGLGGKYLVTASVDWDLNGTGQRILNVRTNGSSVRQLLRGPAYSANAMQQTSSCVLDLVAGDYVENVVYQDSGANRTVGGDGRSFLQIVKLDSGKVGAGIGARAYNNTTQGSLASGSVNALDLNSEDFDTDGFHSTSSNTSRFTIPAGLGGTYLLVGKTQTDQAWQPYWKKNGATILTASALAVATGNAAAVNVEVLAVGDYVEFCEYHASGTATAGHASARHVQTEGTIMRLDSGGSGSSSSLTVSETDASPSVLSVDEIQFPPGTVTDVGNGVVSVRDVPKAFIGCYVNAGSSTSLTNGSYVSIAFSGADSWDTDGFHDTSTNNTRMTVPAGLGGYYMVGAVVGVGTGTNTDRSLSYRVNGGSEVRLRRDYWNMAGTPVTPYINGSSAVRLNAGDYVEIRVHVDQSSLTSSSDSYAWLTKIDSGKVGAGIGARATKSGTQTLTTATWTPVSFTGTDFFDTDGFHNPASNDSRMTIPAGLGGKYLVGGDVLFDSSSGTGSRYYTFYKNGTNESYNFRTPSEGTGHDWGQSRTLAMDLAAGDYVEAYVYQDSGGSLNLDGASFWIMRLDSGAGSNASTYPTVLATSNNEVAGNSIDFTISAYASGKRFVLGVWGTTGDITGVTCTNVTWTKVRDGAFSTTLFADIWVGVATGTTGTTITATKSSGGSNFMGGAVAVLDDLLTPTVAHSTSVNGTEVTALASTTAAIDGPLTQRALFACFGAQQDGSTPTSVMCSLPHVTVKGTRFPLLLGYVPATWTGITTWLMGGTTGSSSDFVNNIAVVT